MKSQPPERQSPSELALVEELKVRARVQLNRARREGQAGGVRLRDTLHEVARAQGFTDWEHARLVLSGMAVPGEDMGSFWHVPRTGILLNLWFSSHDEALAVLQQHDGYLLPYRRQCFIVQSPFIEALGMDPLDSAWSATGRDLVAAYGTPAWRTLAWQRLRAMAQAL